MKTTAAAVFALFASPALASVPVRAENGSRWILEPQSSLWLEGDSTLHRWSSTSTAVGFEAAIPSGKKAEEIINDGLVKDVKVTMPVASLKSGEKGLDKNMQKALKADADPNIVFKMDAYRVVKDGYTAKISATGTLSIAGKDQTIKLDVAWKMRDGRAVFDGRYPLEMTDYGVKPPTLLLGAIKVDKHVVVNFHLELAADEPQKDAGGK